MSFPIILIICIFAEKALAQQYFDHHGSSINEVNDEFNRNMYIVQKPGTLRPLKQVGTTPKTVEHDSSHDSIMVAYESSIFTTLGIALLLSILFMVRMCIRKIKRRKLEEDFSMTSLDARLSCQFLSDFPQTNRTLQTASFEVPTLTKNTKVSEISTPAKIVTAVSPIPSKICVTSPKGDRKKSIWEMELPKIDVEHVPSRSRRDTIRKSSSFCSSTPNNRRDAFSLLSDENVMAELKSLKKKEKKKRWKKIVNQKM